MQTIGLMMVVRNEATRIKNFLDYTLNFVDAVCIADQQSDDGTWELLQEYQKNSKIPFDIWQDELHGISEPSKQPTADRLQTDWILYLDPDEIAEQTFLEKMHELVENPDIDGYWLKRQNVFLVRIYGENTPIEPKVLNVVHPAKDDQLRLTRKKYSMFPPQIHVRVRVRRSPEEDGKQRTEHTEYSIIHQKTLQEQFEDDKRYEEPVREVQEQVEKGTAKNW